MDTFPTYLLFNNHMSYPMNEYGTGAKVPTRTADPWLVASEYEACNTDQKTRPNLLSTIQNFSTKVKVTNELIHRNPYTAIFMGLGAGTLLGIALTGQLLGRRI